MFGPKIRNVFKSRWHALAWAGSILVTAYCSVPSADDGGDDDGLTQFAASLAAHAGDQKPVHKNPWALDRPAN